MHCILSRLFAGSLVLSLILAACLAAPSLVWAHSLGGRVTISKADGTVVRVHEGGHRWGNRRYHRHYDRDVVVDAPAAYVDTRGHRRVWVDAPFAAVRVHPRGVWIRAPFVDIYVPR